MQRLVHVGHEHLVDRHLRAGQRIALLTLGEPATHVLGQHPESHLELTEPLARHAAAPARHGRACAARPVLRANFDR